jgi:hypothetical protein
MLTKPNLVLHNQHFTMDYLRNNIPGLFCNNTFIKQMVDRFMFSTKQTCFIFYLSSFAKIIPG